METKKQKTGQSQRGKKKTKNDNQFNANRKPYEEKSQTTFVSKSLPTDMDQLFENLDDVEVTVISLENQLWYNVPIQIESHYSHASFVEYGRKIFLGVLLMDAHFDIETNPTSVETSEVSVIVEPHTRRNIFNCISIHDENYLKPILYGDEFYICLCGTEGPKMYVTGIAPHLGNFGEPKGRIPLTLTSIPDAFSKFRVIDPDPARMAQLVGTPVKCLERVSILHSNTNMLLAVDITNAIRTLDSVDYRPHCYTYRDNQLRITSENFWKFVIYVTEDHTGENHSTATN